MTKKDYIFIADLLGNKLKTTNNYSIESQSLMLAVIEDFINLLRADNERFNKKIFIEYINKNYGTTLLVD
jgi:hypothetical protein